MSFCFKVFKNNSAWKIVFSCSHISFFPSRGDMSPHKLGQRCGRALGHDRACPLGTRPCQNRRQRKMKPWVRQSLWERNLTFKLGFSSWENRGSSSREAFLKDRVEGHSRAEALRIKCEIVRGLLRGITGEEQQKTLFRTKRASFPWITVSGTVLCTTFGTSIHQLRKTWIASSFRLLYHLIPWLKKKLSLILGPCYSYIFSGVRETQTGAFWLIHWPKQTLI